MDTLFATSKSRYQSTTNAVGRAPAHLGDTCMTGNLSSRRAHQRFNVNQPCRLTIGHSQFTGQDDKESIIINISKGGAGVRFTLTETNPPKVGTPVNIYIDGVGDFPSKVMRSYADGFAIAFGPRMTCDKQLIDKLDRLLPNNTDGGMNVHASSATCRSI